MQKFKLDICYKLKKEYIIPDTLNCLASINVGLANPSYSELNELFTYNMTFIEIHFILILQILVKYKAEAYWLRL